MTVSLGQGLGGFCSSPEALEESFPSVPGSAGAGAALRLSPESLTATAARNTHANPIAIDSRGVRTTFGGCQ